MKSNKKPEDARASDKLLLRLPAGVRDRLRSAAKENSKTLTAEILDRLVESFMREPGSPVADMLAEERTMAEERNKVQLETIKNLQKDIAVMVREIMREVLAERDKSA